MCGIAGEIDFKDSVELADYHEKMLLSMKRRGPDGHGIYRAQNAVLLHSRLAVIDVENGKIEFKTIDGLTIENRVTSTLSR